MFNCSMEMIPGLFFNYMSVQAFGMHRVYKQQNVSRKKLVQFFHQPPNIGQIVGHFIKIFCRNQKKQGFLLRDLHSVKSILSHHHTENHVGVHLVGIFLSILRIKLEQKRQQPMLDGFRLEIC